MHGTARARLRGLLLGVLTCLLVAACGGPGAPRSGGSVADGTVVFGTDQEPAIINPWLSEGNLQATHTLTLPVLYPLWRVTPDFEYEPLLLDGMPTVSRKPFTVTYRLKEEAEWSNGVPITARDIAFTLRVCRNAEFDIAVREGCNAVDLEASEVVDDKTYKMVFKRPYAPWKSLFSSAYGAILPAHELAGKDFNTIWNEELTVASGPFEFADWDRGQDLTLKRNENWWGEETPGLDRVVVRFIEDSSSQVQALRGGEIDVLASQAQLELVDQVNKIRGVTSAEVAGSVWEFFEFNFATPGLGDGYRFVRRAIAHGIDRDLFVDELIGSMGPGTKTLNSLTYVNSQDEYQAAFDRYDYDPDKARRLLRENGCVRGEDGIFTCDGVRLSFRFGFTSDNELRELQFVVFQEQLAKIGIELKAQSQDSATYFGDTWPAGPDGAWDMFDQAWLGAPDPDQALPFWECEGELNFRSYCNRQVHRLIQQSRTELDQDARTRLLNRANELMARDLPALPLYQKPTFLAWDSRLTGPEPNPTAWGHLWNLEQWRPVR